MILLAVYLVALTGPNEQRIEVNPAQVVSLRAPRSEEHFAQGVQCLLHTVDGKFIAVVEPCDAVRLKLSLENVE